MHIEVVPNRTSRPTILLREGWREEGRVRKRTLANLTHWPAHQVDALRHVLKGEALDTLRHRAGTDVKAVTMYGFSVRREATGWISEVVLDV